MKNNKPPHNNTKRIQLQKLLKTRSLTTKEAAKAVDTHPQYAYTELRRLEDRGSIKRTGAKNKIIWTMK